MNSSPKSPKDSLVTSRKLVMPDQINPNGSLFGGVLMSWMDKVAFMTSQRHSERMHVVTVNIDRIQFFQPIKVGAQVLLTSLVSFVGRSSMEVDVKVEKEELGTPPSLAASAAFTFVALDETGRPTIVPRLLPTEGEEIERSYIARMRTRVRQRFQAWLTHRLELRQLNPQAKLFS